MASTAMHSEKVSSTASEKGRRSSKPIIEKRRRARINGSLAEIKTMLMDVIQSEGVRHGKLEKADILEMTVKYLRNIERKKYASVTPSDRGIINEYRIGFTECTNETGRFLESLETFDVDVKSRLMEHLAITASNVEQAQDLGSNHLSSRFTEGIKELIKPCPGTSVLSTNFSPVPREPLSQTSYPCLSSTLNVPVVNSSKTEKERNLSLTITSTNPSNSTALLTTELLDQNNNLQNAMRSPNTVCIPISLPKSRDRVNDTDIPSSTTLDSGFSTYTNASSVISGLRILPIKLPTQNNAIVLSSDLLVAGQVSGCVVPMYTSSTALPVDSCFIQTHAPTLKLQSEITQSIELPVSLDEKSSSASFNVTQNLTYFLPSTTTPLPIFSKDTETSKETMNNHMHAHHMSSLSSAREQKELQTEEHMWRPW